MADEADDELTPEEQADHERVLALVNKVGEALDGSTYEDAVEACAINIAKICDDMEAGEGPATELLLRGLSLVHQWYDEFRRLRDEDEVAANVAATSGSEPPKAN